MHFFFCIILKCSIICRYDRTRKISGQDECHGNQFSGQVWRGKASSTAPQAQTTPQTQQISGTECAGKSDHSTQRQHRTKLISVQKYKKALDGFYKK
jgi:hypothetical protein